MSTILHYWHPSGVRSPIPQRFDSSWGTCGFGNRRIHKSAFVFQAKCFRAPAHIIFEAAETSKKQLDLPILKNGLYLIHFIFELQEDLIYKILYAFIRSVNQTYSNIENVRIGLDHYRNTISALQNNRRRIINDVCSVCKRI